MSRIIVISEATVQAYPRAVEKILRGEKLSNVQKQMLISLSNRILKSKKL